MHHVAERADAVMVGVRGVEDGGVPHTFELDFFPGDAAGIVKIAGLEHREYRRKLFMRRGARAPASISPISFRLQAP